MTTPTETTTHYHLWVPAAHKDGTFWFMRRIGGDFRDTTSRT